MQQVIQVCNSIEFPFIIEVRIGWEKWTGYEHVKKSHAFSPLHHHMWTPFFDIANA